MGGARRPRRVVQLSQVPYSVLIMHVTPKHLPVLAPTAQAEIYPIIHHL